MYAESAGGREYFVEAGTRFGNIYVDILYSYGNITADYYPGAGGVAARLGRVSFLDENTAGAIP